MDPATEQRIAEVPSLDDIARDPGCAGGLPPRTLAALQSRAAVVQAALAAEALTTATETVQGQSRGNQPVPAMGFLTAKQMAEYLKVPEARETSKLRYMSGYLAYRIALFSVTRLARAMLGWLGVDTCWTPRRLVRKNSSRRSRPVALSLLFQVETNPLRRARTNMAGRPSTSPSPRRPLAEARSSLHKRVEKLETGESAIRGEAKSRWCA